MQPGGRLTAINVPLRILISSAYSVDHDSQLLGGPAWIGADRFDIIAKSEGNPAPQIRLMLRALLADRFKLVVHNETRQLPVYALVLARRDGRLGPQLRRAAADCSASRGRLSVPSTPATPSERPTCGTRMTGGGKLVAGGIPISQLVGLLAGTVRRIVQDRTGLTGNFDLDLHWTPDQFNNPAALTDDSPSISTAVQEQLGLKLESTQGTVDVLVIDHVEHPTED